MIRDYMGGFVRVMAVFIMQLILFSGLTVFEMAPQTYALTGSAAGERVDVVGADSCAEKTVEQMESTGSVVIFEGSAKPSATVTIKASKRIRCEGFKASYFKATCGDVTAVAYCVEPNVKSGKVSNKKVNAYNDALMRKVLHYSYGYPGYNKRTKAYLDSLDMLECYGNKDGRYVFCHLMLSFVYDGEKEGSSAFRGCSEKTRKNIKDLLAEIKSWPEPDSEAALRFSDESVRAEWKFDKDYQITPPITLLANSRDNYITVDVPENVTMYRYAAGADNNCLDAASADMFNSGDEDIIVRGGESFRFSAPSAVKGTYQSPVMRGAISTTQPYLLHLTDKQDRIFGLEDYSSVAFRVEWVEFGDLVLQKYSSDEALTESNEYYSLEGALYQVNCRETGESVGLLMTDVKGRGVLKNLPYGDYSLLEKEAPRGFSLDLNSYDFSLNSKEEVVSVKENPTEISLRTSACEKDSGAQSFYEHGKAVIKDTITYSGLEPGQEYRLCGRLVDKKTGEPFEGLSSKRLFIPEKSSGEICVEFNIDSDVLAGSEIVVFESLYYGDSLLSSHEDINDEAQTIRILERSDHTPQTGDEIPAAALLVVLIAAAAVLYGGFVRSSGKSRCRGSDRQQ